MKIPIKTSLVEANQPFHYGDVVMGRVASQITSLTIVYLTVYSGADQIKNQSSASLAFVRGIHRGPVNSPHKWPVMRKMFPFDDVIMFRFTKQRALVINAKTSCPRQKSDISLRLPDQFETWRVPRRHVCRGVYQLSSFQTHISQLLDAQGLLFTRLYFANNGPGNILPCHAHGCMKLNNITFASSPCR